MRVSKLPSRRVLGVESFWLIFSAGHQIGRDGRGMGGVLLTHSVSYLPKFEPAPWCASFSGGLWANMSRKVPKIPPRRPGGAPRVHTLQGLAQLAGA